MICVNYNRYFNSVGKYTEPKANAADKNKGKLSRPLNSIRNGLSIEAYRLSDQANRLIQQGGVTVIPGTLVADGSDTISKRKPSSLTRRATSSGSSSTESIAQRRQLHLHKQVLFKNRETTVVEPLLLALPLPILQKLPSSATPRSTTTATTASATAPSNFNFLHLFPTESELRHSVTTATLSRKLILQLVLKMEKGLSSELKDKLRDIHLLKYLNEYFDHSSVCSIAQCVVSDSSTKLPSSVLMAIQMTKPILQDSGIDSDESEL